MYNDEDNWTNTHHRVITNETRLTDIIKKSKEIKKLLCDLLEQTKIDYNTFQLNIMVWDNENINGDDSGSKLQLCNNLQKLRECFHNEKIEKKRKELEDECKELEKELEEKQNEKLNLKNNIMDIDME